MQKNKLIHEISAIVSIIQQGIGRVLLILFNNAFFAELKWKKQHPGGYEPIGAVSSLLNTKY